MKKTHLAYANNKSADQTAQMRSLISPFAVCYLDIIIPLLPTFYFSRLFLISATLILTSSEISKTGLVTMKLM